MNVHGEKRLLGIVGKPVRGSLSPAMHAAAFRHLGIEAVYLPFEIPPKALGSVIAAMPYLSFMGMNVMIPYKEKAMRFLDEVTDEAREVGAVNTIAVRSGKLVGYNTDGAGFVTALQAEGGVSLRGETVTILGAGGAAKGIACSLAKEGCRCMYIANRTKTRAASLRRRLVSSYPRMEIHAMGLEGRSFDEALASSRVLVNTTSVGMGQRDRSIVPASRISSSHLVVDIVYKPLRTPLIRAAEKAGASFLNGIGMLLYQGVLSFRIWTRKPAPVEVMRRALHGALGRGNRR